MKLIISESEKNRILGMHNKVRNLLFEQTTITVGGITVTIPAGITVDPDFIEASKWIIGKYPPPKSEIAVWQQGNYAYTRYRNYQGNWMEIQSAGKKAMEHKGDGTSAPIHEGNWSWDGNKVSFSWMQSTANNWDKAKKWLLDLPNTEPDTFKQDTVESEGIWNDYEWARVQYKGDNPTTTHMDEADSRLEIMNNGKAQLHYYDSSQNDLIRYGRWKWDDSSNKVIFDWSYTKNSKGTISDSDTNKNSLTSGEKLMKVGSQGELVKWVQHLVTPDDSKDWGTGMGCHSDESKCDGKYGPKTKELVRNFQKVHDLHADGIVGSETARYMKDFETDEDEKSPNM
jgi:peptidoglycan hydrolase-like protein with peptidoglycan-binding domain